MQAESNPSEARGLVKQTLTIVSICVAVILGVLLLGYAAEVFLLAFAGILLAVWLRSLSKWVEDYVRLPSSWAYAGVLVFLVAILGLGLWWLAPHVETQIEDLSTTLPQTVNEIKQTLQNYTWGQVFLIQIQQAEEFLPGKANLVAKATGVFSTSLGFVANLAIVLFLGLFLAANPKPYTAGLIALLPVDQRPRSREVLQALEETLQWWLLGKLMAMGTVGVLMASGLWLLNVPLALTLGLLAAALTFIPYVGPLLAIVPAALLALSQSPMQALYVLLLYGAVQGIESYILTPLIQKRTVALPPALTLSAQVLLGLLLGGLGLALATPLVAVAVVLVKMLYIEDFLGETASS